MKYTVRNTNTDANLTDTFPTREAAKDFAESLTQNGLEYAVVALPTAEDIAAAVADMKAEILADIADGTQPADVADFSTLHDYVDANCYGGMCDDDKRADWDVDALIAIQEVVHQWLVAGRPAE